jgi:hypothetical protein
VQNPSQATRRLPSLLCRSAASLVLGGLTTVGACWSLARWLPMQGAPGIVALDGDHLRPWLLRLTRRGADRIIWFEKGRIYNRPGIGPPGGSSAAVACWSFAISTRRDPAIVTGAIDPPPDLRDMMARTPPTVWGVIDDRRGWPLPAMRSVAFGMTDPRAQHIYESRNAVLFQPPSNATSRSLADLRPLPLEPLWPGFLANSALAAGLWWIVLAAAGRMSAALRARFRIPAGRCPGCGYDLRATGGPAAGCPECGWNRAAAS